MFNCGSKDSPKPSMEPAPFGNEMTLALTPDLSGGDSACAVRPRPADKDKVIASKPSSVAFHAEPQSVGILNVFIGEGSERQLTRQPEPLERGVWCECSGCSCWGKRGGAR